MIESINKKESMIGIDAFPIYVPNFFQKQHDFAQIFY